MKKNREEKIKRMYTSLGNHSEEDHSLNRTDHSNDLEKLELELEDRLLEMKEVYQNHPEPNYFHKLSNTVLYKAEAATETKFQPSFAYAFAVAIVIFLSAQIFNFNSSNFTGDYSDLINAPDIEDYLTFENFSELNDFDEIIDDEIDLDYTAYLLNVPQNVLSYQSSVESDILNMLDNNTAEIIYNEISRKKIL